jgi:RNA polymerase sigma factor (sigma-70 family)
MPTQINEVVQHLRRTILRHDEAGLTDGQLLGRFIEQRDEAAVAALVRRHGPMIWGVCRRILRTHHDAEDAFQATFLVLVRKAGSVRKREMVGNWLYGVAHQTALKARETAAKRYARERQVVDMPEPTVKDAPDLSGELQAVLDQELSRLPDKYRVGIVLCDLEGKTRKEAARQLGLPEGTLAGRLTRGRAMLAKRLARHGLAVTGGTLSAWLSRTAASASVPTSVLSSTMKIVTLVAAGKTAATGLVSAKVATLTEGVLKAMLISKLKTVVAVVLVLGLIVTGATVLSCRTSAAQGDKPPIAEERVKTPQKQEPEREKDVFTAWGKEVGGLQAGLGFHPGEKRAYRHGETVKLVVRVRNVSKEAIKFEYLKQFFIENPPTVTDGKGKPVPQTQVEAGGRVHVPVEVNLAPGKEIELTGSHPYYELKYELRPKKWIGNDGFSALYGTGTFSVQCERVFGNTSAGSIKLDPNLSKLATGKLELEIKTAAPAENEKKAPPKQEKEAFTAWGKEVGGLQAGLGFRPGEKRVYHHGDVIALVVRVRNVGKQTVKFEYVRQFLDENLPTVTNADGKTVEQHRLAMLGFHVPMEVTLEPGKEIELEARLPLLYEFRPANGGGKPTTKERHLFVGTGKVSIQYEQVLGNSSSGAIKLDPALSKLATGKLELEVKEPEKQPPEKESFTAWGKEAGGLQAGLGFHPGEKRAYHHGETVKLVVRVRNVGKEAIKFEYLRQFFIENPPAVTEAVGKPVPLERVTAFGFHTPVKVNLAPGKEIELYEWTPKLKPASEKESGNSVGPDWLLAMGKVSVQYDRVFGNSSAGRIELDPTLSKLATGKLEIEIKPAPPATNEKKAPQKQEPGDKTAKKFWAGMSVNQPLFRAEQNTNLLQFNFALVNESYKVIDPKIPGYPRLIVNGKELDLSSIPGVGPRDGRFKALPPGDNLQFGMGAGQFFDKPGVYRVYWQGEEFRSNEVVFRVLK